MCCALAFSENYLSKWWLLMFLLIVVRRQEKLQTDMTLGVQLRPPTSEILLEHHSAMVPHEGFNETPHYEGLKVTPNYIERIFFSSLDMGIV